MLTRINTRQLSLDGTIDTPISTVQGEFKYKTPDTRYLYIKSASYNATTSILTIVFSDNTSVELPGFIRTVDLPKGAQGDRGRKGADGADGFNGRDGEQGLEGKIGKKGYIGDVGEQGPRGFAGRKGAKGYKGERGERGEDGNDGSSGIKGIAGKTGSAGKDDSFVITVSESNPGATGPGSFWIKPSGFSYPEDPVSFTLVATESAQHLWHIQELHQIAAQGVEMPGPWFDTSRDITTNEHAFFDSTVLANFFDEKVFTVYKNLSSFGEISYVVKADGGIVELGNYDTCVVSNILDRTVALASEKECCLYNTQYEYIQERLILNRSCNAIALTLDSLLLACDDGLYRLQLADQSETLVRPGAWNRLLVANSTIYAFGESNIAIGTDIRDCDYFDYIFENEKFILHEHTLSSATRSFDNVSKVVVSDRIYIGIGDAVYALTAEGYQFITDVTLNWYIGNGVLVEYDATAFFMESI